MGCFHVLAIVNSAAKNIGGHFSLSWRYWLLLAEPSPGSHVICIKTVSKEDSYVGSPSGKFRGLLWFWNCTNFICQTKLQLRHWSWAQPETQPYLAVPLGFLARWKKKLHTSLRFIPFQTVLHSCQRQTLLKILFTTPKVISLFNVRALNFCFFWSFFF